MIDCRANRKTRTATDEKFMQSDEKSHWMKETSLPLEKVDRQEK